MRSEDERVLDEVPEHRAMRRPREVAVSALAEDPAVEDNADAFARSLAVDCEHKGDVLHRLYGFRIDRRRSDPLVREAQFFDGRFGSWRPAVHPVRRLAQLAAAVVAAAEVDVVRTSGAVVQPADVANRDAASDLWNLPDAQRRSDAYFRTTRRLLPIRLPTPVRAMLWTKSA